MGLSHKAYVFTRHEHGGDDANMGGDCCKDYITAVYDTDRAAEEHQEKNPDDELHVEDIKVLVK